MFFNISQAQVKTILFFLKLWANIGSTNYEFDFEFLYLLGSGLSSSAAFVCSSTIAIMAAFGVNFPKLSIITLLLALLLIGTKWFHN